MTVSELIEALKGMPQEREVLMVISCDSYGGDADIQVKSRISEVDELEEFREKFVTLEGC